MRHAQDFEFRCRRMIVEDTLLTRDNDVDVKLIFVPVSDVLAQIDTELIVQYLHENTHYKCVALEQA